MLESARKIGLGVAGVLVEVPGALKQVFYLFGLGASTQKRRGVVLSTALVPNQTF